jgi:hypothetical protein
MPLIRLLLSTVTSSVSTTGTALARSVMSMRATPCSIRMPTITSAGAVACGGMMTNTGQKNSATANSATTVNEVSPVRPPACTPVTDSM